MPINRINNGIKYYGDGRDNIVEYFRGMGFTVKCNNSSMSIAYKDEDIQSQELYHVIQPSWRKNYIARVITMYHKDEDSFDYVKIVWQG